MKPRPCCHSPEDEGETLSALTGRLRGKDRRLTAPRQAILAALRAHRHPLTNKEVLALLPSGHCDLATIYRSMHPLVKTGIVQRFDFGDGVARYELVPEGSDGHHHHLICTACQRVVEIEECFPRDLELAIAKKNGFGEIRHKLEFFGLCPACRGK